MLVTGLSIPPLASLSRRSYNRTMPTTRLKRVVVFMEPEKHRELKYKALDAGASNLSEYMRAAGTVADQNAVRKAISQPGVPEQK